jgi:hypothetical protein
LKIDEQYGPYPARGYDVHGLATHGGGLADLATWVGCLAQSTAKRRPCQPCQAACRAHAQGGHYAPANRGGAAALCSLMADP